MQGSTVGVLLRKMVELEQQGAGQFFGEPEFDVKDLLTVTRDGRGVITCLELADVQDKPALFSTFMMWVLAELYHNLPEAGDLPKPKLVPRLGNWNSILDYTESFSGVPQSVKLEFVNFNKDSWINLYTRSDCFNLRQQEKTVVHLD
jgi:hypothetical protein